ncbi:MAG: HD-GYP domain-containing protein [Desulfurobacteriaceae bacterium]
MVKQLNAKENLLRRAFEESYRIKKENPWFKSLSLLLKALSIRDTYTEGHSNRVALYSLLIAQALGITGEELSRIYIGAFLHDIGKIGIPDAILLKPTALTPVERELVKKHPILGFELLKEKKRKIPRILDIILKHHERIDGKGYPYGMNYREIPVYVNIVSIADVFDAITTERPYRGALSLEAALNIIENDKGKAFYPEVTDVATKILETVGVLDIGKDSSLTEDLEKFRKEAFFRDLITGLPVFSRWKEILFFLPKKSLYYTAFDVKGLLFVNLTRGWEEGDRVLSEIGSEIRKRKIGNFCRLSGGTFLGILHDKKVPLFHEMLLTLSSRLKVTIDSAILNSSEVKYTSVEELVAILVKRLKEKKSLKTKGGIEKLLRKSRS